MANTFPQRATARKRASENKAAQVGTNSSHLHSVPRDRKLEKREQDALVAVTLSTATLIVCFTYALSLI
jgi:hypothetical protein